MKEPWPRIPLGQVLEERRVEPSPGKLASGEIGIVAKIGFNDGKIQLRSDGNTRTGMILIQPGDLVVSGINAAKGAIAIYGEENKKPIAATIHYGSYILKKERVNITFLWWLLRSGTFRDLLLEYVPGGIKTELKAKRFLPIPIPLPPLPEQRRIVARIEELAAKIKETQSLRNQVIEETAKLVTSAGRNIFGHPNKTVGEVADVTKLAGFEYTEFFTHAVPGDVRVIRASNVRDDGLDLKNAMTIETYVSDRLPRSQIKPRDVVMTFIGANIGDVTFIPDDSPRLHCGPNVAKISPREPINYLYLVRALQTSMVNDQILDITKSTAQPSLSMSTIRQLRIPVPTLKDQVRITAFMDLLQKKVDSLKWLQKETTVELEALLPSVLDRAFKGGL